MGIGGRLRSGVRALGMMLIGEQLASEEEVKDALAEQRRRRRRGGEHRRLGEILVEKSVVSRGQVDEVLARQEAALEIDSRVVEGGDLKICGLHGKAAALFEVIGLEAFFEIADDEEQALAAFARPVPEGSGRKPCARCARLPDA